MRVKSRLRLRFASLRICFLRRPTQEASHGYGRFRLRRPRCPSLARVNPLSSSRDDADPYCLSTDFPKNWSPYTIFSVHECPKCESGENRANSSSISSISLCSLMFPLLPLFRAYFFTCSPFRADIHLTCVEAGMKPGRKVLNMRRAEMLNKTTGQGSFPSRLPSSGEKAKSTESHANETSNRVLKHAYPS